MLLQWQNSGGVDSLLNTAGFIAPFWDAGAGAVDTALWRGVGSPTFTRATTATTVDSTGTIVSVASGTARSYYDPTTLTYGGYLAEGARTNICLQSADFGTTWTNANSTDSLNAAVAPDGTTTADKLIPDAASVIGRFVQSGLTLTAGQTYTLSVFAKAAEFSLIQLKLLNTGADSVLATFNASTGAVAVAAAVTGVWTSPSSSVTQFPNGWWRFSVTVTCTTNAGDRTQLVCTDTGDGTSGILLWGAQVENAAFASTYIPTTTAAVTRNADVLTYTFAGNASATVGTMYAEISTLWSGNSSGTNIVVNTGATSSLYIASGQAVTTISCNDGPTAVTKTGLSSVATAIRKRASSFGAAGQLLTGDGATVQTGTFDGAIANTAIAIGCTTSSALQLFGTIRNARIWTTQFSASQLQAITG